jgi:Zn2+/Cd2+-exporting ATPase
MRITHIAPVRSLDPRAINALLGGALIAAALVAGWGLGMEQVRDGLMVAAAVVFGGSIAARAWRALRSRHVSIELLVTIAAVGALIIGDYWEAAAVTFLFSLGGYLESRSMSRTRRALGELLESAPVVALVRRAGGWMEVPALEVRHGETVLVKPGSRIPVDGQVITGGAAVDESMITGEPHPAEKGPGDAVFAGTVSGNGMVQVRAIGVGADTALARIVRRVEQAQEEKAPTQRFIDRFARWYTPAIIGLAAGAYVVTSDPRLALTLLVVACPGALVIATPVSVVAGIGRAARKGILIKGGQHLESAAGITAVALDKTGTLTRGEPTLQEIVALETARPAVVQGGLAERDGGHERGAADGWSPQAQQVLRWAAIAETASEHPLAAPILKALGDVSLPQPERFEAIPGKGVRAIHDGRDIVVGNHRMLEQVGVPLDDEARAAVRRLRQDGSSPVLVAVDREAIGVLGFADGPRDNARDVVARLRRHGIRRVVMLTGDDRLAARAVAGALGVDEVHAEQLPDQKLDRIRELQRQGERVAMVGDGINDAPALAAADVGIAMGAAGTDIAIETADIALMADDLARLPEAIRMAGKTLRNMRQNLALALLTVALLLAGVLAGEVHMAGGMLIHQLSVLAVIVNGMRLIRA